MGTAATAAAMHATPAPVVQAQTGEYPDAKTLAAMYVGIGAHNNGKVCMSACCEGARKAQHRKALKNGTVPTVAATNAVLDRMPQVVAPTPAVVQAPTLTADQQQMADMMRMMQAMAAKLGM